MNSEYSEKLKDPRWQKVRLEVMNRAGWKCECCDDSKSTLHVHHIIYRGNDPWDCPPHLLECLCENCHAFREDFNAEFGRKRIPTRVCRVAWTLVKHLNDNYMDISNDVIQATDGLKAHPWWIYLVKASERLWPKSIYSYVNGILSKCAPPCQGQALSGEADMSVSKGHTNTTHDKITTVAGIATVGDGRNQ